MDKKTLVPQIFLLPPPNYRKAYGLTNTTIVFNNTNEVYCLDATPYAKFPSFHETYDTSYWIGGISFALDLQQYKCGAILSFQKAPLFYSLPIYLFFIET